MSEINKEYMIDDDALNGVSGGLIFDASMIDGSDPFFPYEVLDDNTGRVLLRAATEAQAREYAEKLGMSVEITDDWDRVQRLRSWQCM